MPPQGTRLPARVDSATTPVPAGAASAATSAAAAASAATMSAGLGGQSCRRQAGAAAGSTSNKGSCGRQPARRAGGTSSKTREPGQADPATRKERASAEQEAAQLRSLHRGAGGTHARVRHAAMGASYAGGGVVNRHAFWAAALVGAARCSPIAVTLPTWVVQAQQRLALRQHCVACCGRHLGCGSGRDGRQRRCCWSPLAAMAGQAQMLHARRVVEICVADWAQAQGVAHRQGLPAAACREGHGHRSGPAPHVAPLLPPHWSRLHSAGVAQTIVKLLERAALGSQRPGPKG